MRLTPIYDETAWAHGFAPLTDDDAVDAENNRHQGAHNHAADDQWGDLPVMGGDAA
jgi:hypothetical protein